jgi:hypothetical protein
MVWVSPSLPEFLRIPIERYSLIQNIAIERKRYFCIGRVGNRIMTVRFSCRNGKIRIYGAGYWRKGRRYYEEE